MRSRRAAGMFSWMRSANSLDEALPLRTVGVERKQFFKLVENEQRRELRRRGAKRAATDLRPKRFGSRGVAGLLLGFGLAFTLKFEPGRIVLDAEMLFRRERVSAEANGHGRHQLSVQQRHHARLQQGGFAVARFGKQHHRAFHRNEVEQVAGFLFPAKKEVFLLRSERGKAWVAGAEFGMYGLISIHFSVFQQPFDWQMKGIYLHLLCKSRIFAVPNRFGRIE